MGKMIGYFIANQDSVYYQSPRFTQVLKYMQTHPKGVSMSEKNNKLRLIYDNVKTMPEAIIHLTSVLETQS
jgi:transcription-repair coupling factor (superfamily II helicase)